MEKKKRKMTKDHEQVIHKKKKSSKSQNLRVKIHLLFFIIKKAKLKMRFPLFLMYLLPHKSLMVIKQ